MKDLIKRVLAVICAVGVMSAYTGIIASAAATPRPMPGTEENAGQNSGSSEEDNGSSYGVSAIDETRARSASSSAVNYVASSENGDESDEDTQNSEPEQDESVQAPTVIPVNAGDYNQEAPQAPQESSSKERGGVSMGAVFLWFLAAIIINAIVSFWVGNRFYKMAKKDTHVTAEVRALRRDVEEKFISNVGGFTEMENEISNSNDDYSMDEEGIKIPERKARESHSPAVSDGFEEDAFRRWESRQAEAARAQTEREQPKKNVEQTQRINTSRIRARREEPERELRKKQYQPKRGVEYVSSFEDDDDDERRETRTAKKTSQNVNAVKSKAKEFLGDIFPFKED